jgi:hypothetical protein
MPQYVQKEVQAARENPDAEASAELIIGVDGSHHQVRQLVTENGGEIVEELPFDSLHVEVPEVALDAVCESLDVGSVEYNTRVR